MTLHKALTSALTLMNASFFFLSRDCSLWKSQVISLFCTSNRDLILMFIVKINAALYVYWKIKICKVPVKNVNQYATWSQISSPTLS